jgi:hypothetical protein
VKPRHALPALLLLAVAVRVPFWVEALRTPLDGDAAIIGLMARHPGRGLTMWGQPYGSPLEAWLAAPLVAAMGPRDEPVRLLYFLLGLALVPVAFALGWLLDPRAATPAALLAACPPPYLLLLSSLPPPMYPLALLLAGGVLATALAGARVLAAGEHGTRWLVAWGALSGLAVWTHLMTASVVLVSAVHLARAARGRGRVWWPAAAALLLTGSPLLWRVAAQVDALRIVEVSGRRQTFGAHLREVLPHLHEPVGGLIGTHVPLVPDDALHVVFAPGWAAGALVAFYGIALLLAARRTFESAEAPVLMASAALTLLVFPLPLRSGPETIRFLTPAYLPMAALVAWAALRAGATRRAFVVVLALAALHLAGAHRLLREWRAADRAQPPYLLPDLTPVLRALQESGARRFYASYGPAYRLTYASGETVIGSQPWNERFLHYPLPYLDEVRFAKGVAWVLTPSIPSDLPAPDAFERALGTAGGAWRRVDAGPAAVYAGFVPPFGPQVTPLGDGTAAGDADPFTSLQPSPSAPTTFTLRVPAPLDAITLVAGAEGPRLLRSMDVEVSADGRAFETVARRRRREERQDLRWVNGQPQFVIDHDHLAIPLGGRKVMAIRVTPVASADAWTLSEVLAHPAGTRAPWDEWLDPHLTWPERRRALRAQPRPDRADWYYRLLLASRAR